MDYALALGDDALVLAQRMGEWVTRAPELEEDVALANIGLDLLGQASALLAHAGRLEGAGRAEDELAYLRDATQFRNCLLVELDNGDFAQAMARMLVFSAYQHELYTRLAAGPEPMLAAIAGKAVKEVAYHRDHATEWVLRLGDGTDESRRRMRSGLERLWPYVDELFCRTDRYGQWPEPWLIDTGIAVDPDVIREPALGYVRGVLSRTGLCPPQVSWRAVGGRRGVHTSALAPLLAELQSVRREHPGASW